MKYLNLLFLFLLLFVIAGCTARYVDVRGEKFEMISEKEEKELAQNARIALKTIEKKLPPGDYKHIESTAPEMRFIYSGDRYGRAIVRWQFPRYEAGVEYEGELMTGYMVSTVFTKEKQPEVVDFTRKKPRRSVLPDKRRGKKVKGVGADRTSASE